MARLPLLSGPGVPWCLLLLAAMSSAGVTDGATKGDVTKTGLKLDTKQVVVVNSNKDLAQQESKKVQSPSPTKRHIRKFDFDAEFATYLGLASQADTARYLAGEEDASFRAPAAFQESQDGELIPPLRLVAGSTPASFAYFTQIYPNDHADGDIRIEHFSPVFHPTSSEREKARHRDESEGPEPYDRTKSNYYPSDEALYAPPTSRSYFGRYSNKQKYAESSDDDDKYGPKSSKSQSPKPSKGFDDDSTPDYKMGYRHVGMYHKFHEEDLYPKKTSSEWIPLKKSKLKSKLKSEADRDTNYDPETYHDAHVSEEDFHVKSEHDDEVTKIINNINNDPPYSTNNFDLAEKKFPSVGKFSTKGAAFRGAEGYGKGHSSADALDDSPYEPEQRPQKHKRRRKKKKHHRHHHKRPHGYRSSPAEEANAFSNQGRGSEFKAPTFEFRNPVNTYVNPPYTPPETHKSNLNTEPDFDAPSREDFKSSSGPSAPSEPFRTGPESDLPLAGEPDKDVSFEEPPEVPEEPADIDYGPVKLDEPEEDYHVGLIGGTGPTEHTKDFDKRLPEDGKVYGSFETFDSQLDAEDGKKRFDPFVKFPFDEQRQKLAAVVQELIETGKSRRKK